MGFTPSNMERGVRPSNTGREVGSCCAQLWRSGLKLEMRSWSWLLLLLLLPLDPGLGLAHVEAADVGQNVVLHAGEVRCN